MPKKSSKVHEVIVFDESEVRAILGARPKPPGRTRARADARGGGREDDEREQKARAEFLYTNCSTRGWAGSLLKRT